MAERRMFAKTVIESDLFLDMPQSTQLLYFHLSMRADDDGFINNPKSIMRNVKCNDDDLKLLIAKQFIIPFETGIVVITHWKIHNYIRNDRKHPTKYLEEFEQLILNKDNSYSLCQSNGIPTVGKMDTEVRLGKDSIDNNKYICANSVQNEPECTAQKMDKSAMFESFWTLYPKKVNKKKSKDKFMKICKTEKVFNEIMAGLHNQLKSSEWKKNNGQFIPHPTTWLNGERWKDEINIKTVNEERRIDYERVETIEDDICF